MASYFPRLLLISLSCGLAMPLNATQAEEVSASALFQEGNRHLVEAYSNHQLKAVWTKVRKRRGENGQNVTPMKLEYAIRGDSFRHTIYNTGEDEKRPEVPLRTMVLQLDQSFVIRRVAFGGQEVARAGTGKELYLSLRRSLANDGLGLIAQAWGYFVFDPYHEMIASGRLMLEDHKVDSDELPERLTLVVQKMLLPEDRQELYAEVPNPVTHLTGTITVLPQQSWAVEQLSLKRVRADGTKSGKIEIRVTYEGSEQALPKMKSAHWESDAYLFRLEVSELTFGTVTPEAFAPHLP